MKYSDPQSEALYQQWLETLANDSDPVRIATFAAAMRSKLTSIIASAQMLSDDLSQFNQNLDEEHELTALIVEAARSISVILDAASDVETVIRESSEPE